MCATFERLSPRAREVLALLPDGLANKELARLLGVSESRVKELVAEVLRTLGAPNRTAAAVAWISCQHRDSLAALTGDS
jgi:DNA-binding NarL/FixJ family response regulator